MTRPNSPQERAIFRLLDATGAIGNALAYAFFGIIALIVVYFLLKWGYSSYWISTHCTTVLGTRVCR